jgi:Helix-turn-helix domain of transposase family ISL3
MASITLELDLPEGVTVESYQRHEDAHALEVTWPLPETCTCQRCGHSGPARLEWKDEVRTVRDLDLWNQPCFWVYQIGFHRCPLCFFRQHMLPPFKRKETSYTYRFEEQVVRMLIGSTEEEVARRLGISAETVARIVKYQINAVKEIAADRVITDIGSSVFRCNTGEKPPSGRVPTRGCVGCCGPRLARPDSGPAPAWSKGSLPTLARKPV